MEFLDWNCLQTRSGTASFANALDAG
jgi:hypothetical protein